MKFYIYPKYIEEAVKSGWIVKFLRFIGVIQILGCIALGVTVGGRIIAAALAQAGIMSYSAAETSATLFGLAAGIITGLFVSLTAFALAQVVDDLHALRIQTSAYAAFETDEIKLGR